MKIVYILGGNYIQTGMNSVLSQKLNWLALNTNYEIYAVLTERPDLPMCYPLNAKIKCVNFDIGFDELDTMPMWQKILAYSRKQKKYKKLFSNYLVKLKPDIVVTALRRDLSFINDIPDGSKKIGEIHFPKTHYREFNSQVLPAILNRLITRWWRNQMIREIKRLSAFTVLSDSDKQQWTELKDVKVIGNPLSKFPETIIQCNNHHAIAVGRYSWEKGYDLLLKAWQMVAKKHPEWHLDIYGAGDKDKYINMSKTMNLDDFVTCHPANADIYNRYQEAEFLVLSSRYEGFGLVIAEAMSCERPTVCFDCPYGPRTIIKNGFDGLLAEKENPKDLADKINWMIEHDSERKEMGKRSRESARRFSEDVIMPQWVKLFERVIL